MGLGPDTLPGPVGPYGVCYLDLLYLYAQKLQVNDFISLMVCDLARKHTDGIITSVIECGDIAIRLKVKSLEKYSKKNKD